MANPSADITARKPFLNERKLISYVALLLLLGGLWQFLSATPEGLLRAAGIHSDLSGKWDVCLYREDGSKVCRSLPVPLDLPVDMKPTASEWLVYRTQFSTPNFCTADSVSCSFFAAEVGDALELRLNGKWVGRHGGFPPHPRYAKHYPVSFQMPADMLLLPNKGNNELELKIYSYKKNQSGVRKSPVALVPNEVAVKLVRLLVFQRTILPLMAGAIVLLFGFISLAAVRIYRIRDRQMVSFLAFCLTSGGFLISFSDVPRELFPLSFAGPLHYFLRSAMDLAMLELATECFEAAPWVRRWTRPLYLGFLTVFVAQWLGYSLGVNYGLAPWVGFDGSFRISSWAFPLVILPLVYGVVCSWNGRKVRGFGFFFIFVLALIMQISDRLVMYQWLQQPYYGKLLPLPIVLAFGIKLWIDYLNGVERTRLDAAVGQAASQVAHDIRSPLAALDMVVQGLNDLPEDHRIIVRSATSRIKDIANDLLEKNRAALSSSYKSVGKQWEQASVQLLSSLLDTLVTEKRLQFGSKLGVEIRFASSKACYGLFAKIQPVEFKRVISNLMNNSIEALGDAGLVELCLGQDGLDITLIVQDSGPGMPQSLLAKLGTRGVSHGKEGGSGLGLYHARQTVESWGGNLLIQSEQGRGTIVTIRLPRAPEPTWFVPELKLVIGATVVVLDDDTSIHQIWKQRLSENDSGVRILHFSTPSALREWALAGFDSSTTAFLLDYELRGSSETGLDLIQSLGISTRSILVTSRFEDSAVLNRCQASSIKLLPKPLAASIPVRIVTKKAKFDAVLLDDDPLVHLLWKSVAGQKGKSFAAFSRAEEFQEVVLDYDLETPIYLDSSLGGDAKGEAIAHELHEKGFTNIYIATGYGAESFSHLTWLRGVTGKDAPWA